MQDTTWSCRMKGQKADRQEYMISILRTKEVFPCVSSVNSGLQLKTFRRKIGQTGSSLKMKSFDLKI